MGQRPQDLVGELVGGKFRVERMLGAGGMGTVYVAMQEALGRRVALKVVRGRALDQEQRERFAREAQVVAQLKCPHVVTIHDFGEHEGQPYLAMELLEGETLRDRMSRGAVSPADALAWTRDLSCALRSAHAAGIVHRDVKPENVVLVRDHDRGTIAKLLDFGIAKLREQPGTPGLTGAGVVIGTPGYIAPEQFLRGQSDAPAADIYAVGVVLYEMLAGEAPFAAATPVALLVAHAHEAVPSLAGRPGVSETVAALVDAMLAKNPSRRPADGAVLVEALDLLGGAKGCATPGDAATAGTLAVALPLPDRPSIAVQLFATLGGDADALFAEGISEDILTALSSFKQLFVVAIGSMIHEGARDTDAMRVSRLVGARYVLQGSVRRAGPQLRVNAKLVDGTTGAQVWAQRYDRDVADVFAVQDEVTQAIVACVAGQVEAAHAEHARRKAPHALAAYDWLARGRALHHRRTAQANAEARAALDKAIEVDPDYAQAHAWLACVAAQAVGFGADPARTMTDAVRHAHRGLELDESDAECQRLAAEVDMLRDLDKADYHHTRAIALNPNDARIVGQHGELAMARGDFEKASAALEQAARLDPLGPAPYQRLLACLRYLQRDLDAATRLVRLLGDARADVVALTAAIAALRSDAAALRQAKARLVELGATLTTPRRLFATPALRDLWREGFERAAGG